MGLIQRDGVSQYLPGDFSAETVPVAINSDKAIAEKAKFFNGFITVPQKIIEKNSLCLAYFMPSLWSIHENAKLSGS